MRFNSRHIEHYSQHGYVVVENFLTADELGKAHEEIDRLIPGWLEYALNPNKPKPDHLNYPPRTRRDNRFPFAGEQLNAITLHPDLRAFAAINAGHDALVCEQADLTYKYQGHRADKEQLMHLDYTNHTLVYPTIDQQYWQTAYLIYYTDVDEGLAPTAVCSWQHYKDEILWPTAYEKQKRASLYENEVKVIVPAGSVLAYSMRTFHRGTAFKRAGARIGEFVTYAPSGCPWLGIVGWAEQGVHQSFQDWVETATVEERNLLGFPAPGDAYWNSEALAGAAARFPGMDLSPYQPI
ncbi:MAG: phytanoyl-CoA dioxygenase family protein [Pseudomonadota bacterium]|nr:phytanoyl-CoA dioxygenase family protein [Pseudomonadota bacterium]